MKQLPFFIFTILLVFFSIYGNAQNDGEVTIAKIEMGEKEVGVFLKSSTSFIAGANRFVLHIGSRYFLKNVHPDGSLNDLLFFIPVEDFEQLKENDQIVLVYGFYQDNAEQDNEGKQVNGFSGKHWVLGTLAAIPHN